jgi:two-component system, cell cycle sensor histidine kinase and response regulator CckA
MNETSNVEILPAADNPQAWRRNVSQTLRVLLVEDNPDDAKIMLRELNHAGFETIPLRVETEAAFLESLHGDFDLILADYTMPEFDGLRALALLKMNGLQVPFIFVSGTVGEDIAVEAINRGAADYLLKDRLARLGPAVHRALEQRRLRQEREQAQEALRASEELFRQLAENIDEACWIAAADQSAMLYISPAYEKIWGRTCQSLYEKPSLLIEAIHEQDRARALVAMQAVSRGVNFDLEHRIIRLDGQIRWIHTRGIGVRDEAGTIYRIAGIADDITRRKQAEQPHRPAENMEALTTGVGGNAARG